MEITTTFNGNIYTESELKKIMEGYTWFKESKTTFEDVIQTYGKNSQEYVEFSKIRHALQKFRHYDVYANREFAKNNDSNTNPELKDIQVYLKKILDVKYMNKDVPDKDFNFLSNLFFNDKNIWSYFSNFKIINNPENHVIKGCSKENGEYKTLSEVYEENKGVYNRSFSFLQELKDSLDRVGAFYEFGLIDDEVTSFLCAAISLKCEVCNQRMIWMFNHKDKTIEQVGDSSCKRKKLSKDYLKSKVVTKGKLFVCNDIRSIFSKKQIKEFKAMHDKFNKVALTGVDLDTVLGKHMYVELYSSLFKAAYAMAGNHSCYTNKLSNSELLFTYDNETEFEPICLDLWGIFVMDYEDAHEMATKNGTLDYLLEMEYNIVDVEPGTYELVTDFKAQDGETNNGIEYFAKLIKKSNDVTPIVFDEEKFLNGEWE